MGLLQLVFGIVVLSSLFGFASAQNGTNVTSGTPTWFNVQSQFGPYARPFRYGHAGGVTPFGRIVTFSGITEVAVASRDVSRFNYLSNGNIQTLQTLSVLEMPSRVLSAFVLWKQSVLVTYGGFRGSGIVQIPRLQIFDVTAGGWLNNTESLVTNVNDSNIQNHNVFGAFGTSAVVDDTTDNMYLFGGNAIVFILNFVTRVNLNTQQFFQIHLADTSLVAPSGRYGCAMAFVSSTTAPSATGPALWIFGGKSGLGIDGSQNPNLFNDVFKFNIAGSAWIAATTTGTRPSARAYMSSIVLNDLRTWIIFGGRDDLNKTLANQILFNDIYSFNLQTATWIAFPTAGTPPSARDKALGCHLNWAGEDSLLIHGGSDQNGGALDDFWYLKIFSSGSPPVPPPSTLDIATDSTDVIALPSTGASSSSSSQATPTPPLIISSASTMSSWINLFF